MGIYSAKTGKISANGGTSAMKSIRNINIDYVSDQPEGNMSGANQGAPVSVPGFTDFTGDLEFYGKVFELLPQATFNFESSNGTETATGAAIVESCDLTCSIKDGGLLQGSIRFGGNGALTISNSATAMTDANVPEAYGSIVCKAAWGPIAASPTMADIADVTEWSLQYSSKINDYVTSGSTNGAKRRNAGAINGLTASVNVMNSQPSGLQTANMLPGQYGELRLYVTATEFFAIRWAGVTGWRKNVPIETGANPEIQCGFKWSSYRPITGTQTVGYVKVPAGTTVWP